MDFIFECFYTDTLDQIARNGLQDRSSRRNVLDHLNAIIGGCSDGQNMHTEEVARIAVLSAVRYHREKKEANGDVCLMGKYHNILYIALRTCWDWGVRDSAVVVVLLEEIYACEKTFERIFLGALFGPNAPHFIAGWRSDFRDQDENTRAMVYFLHHATGLNMTLPVWIARYEQERMIKFIDIPIESCGRSSPLRVALQASAPDLLLILLRYGAEPNPPDGGNSVVLSLLDKLIENGRNYVFQHISCLQILLRNITRIELPYKPLIYSTRREMFFERYGRLLIDRIISNDQVYGVMSLRHLCRCRIRDLLRSNGQLPDGIDTLRLPRRLQRYIDLMEEIEGDDNKDNGNGSPSPLDAMKQPKPSASKKPKQPRLKVMDEQQEEEEQQEERESTSAKPSTSGQAMATALAEKCAIVGEAATTTKAATCHGPQDDNASGSSKMSQPFSRTMLCKASSHSESDSESNNVNTRSSAIPHSDADSVPQLPAASSGSLSTSSATQMLIFDESFCSNFGATIAAAELTTSPSNSGPSHFVESAAAAVSVFAMDPPSSAAALAPTEDCPSQTAKEDGNSAELTATEEATATAAAGKIIIDKPFTL